MGRITHPNTNIGPYEIQFSFKKICESTKFLLYLYLYLYLLSIFITNTSLPIAGPWATPPTWILFLDLIVLLKNLSNSVWMPLLIQSSSDSFFDFPHKCLLPHKLQWCELVTIYRFPSTNPYYAQQIYNKCYNTLTMQSFGITPELIISS